MINRVLFLIEKFCDSNPACGPTNSEHLLVGSLKSTGLVGEVKRFYYDEVEKQVGKERTAEMLLNDCQIFHPELVVLTPLGGPLGYGYNPKGETMLRLQAMGIKVLLISFDAKPNCRLETERLPYVSHAGLVGSVRAYRFYRSHSNVTLFYGPADPDTYYNRHLERDIDVSFIGSIDPTDRRWPMRAEYTASLKQNGCNILIAGGQRGKRLEADACAELLSRSKMSINFCRDADMFPNLKSRVFEVMACGAMLLDDWDTDTSELFQPGKDFAIYHSKQELLDLVRHYLEHDAEREEIARAGNEKVANIYNPRNLWGYTLEKMGFEVPESLRETKAFQQHREVMECLSA